MPVWWWCRILATIRFKLYTQALHEASAAVTIQSMDIFRVFQVEAAHHLPNVPAGHKCARLHGHSFRIEVHVSGPVGEKDGWVMDFADLRKIFQPVYDQLDHHYLNEIEGLENPTSENLARWIWRQLTPGLKGLSKIIVQETCNAGCIYYGD